VKKSNSTKYRVIDLSEQFISDCAGVMNLSSFGDDRDNHCQENGRCRGWDWEKEGD